MEQNQTIDEWISTLSFEQMVAALNFINQELCES